MKNTWLITWFTLREAMARKVFIFFAIISLLVILGSILIFSVIDTESLIGGFAVEGQELQLAQIVTALELIIISPLAGLCLLLAIFSSASFIPNMLEKGNIDLLLSKPVSRTQLLWGKYFGGIIVVLLNIAFLILGVWLTISFKLGYWDISFLSVIFVVTFTFAVLYSIIVLFGVLTKSSIFGMMAAYFIFIILSPLMNFANTQLKVFVESETIRGIIKVIYYIVPKTSELMGQITLNLASGKGITDFQPVLTSFLFLILVMGISNFIFVKKDF
ncbi:MAG: ABC transporter permease subunit [Ignavibacteriales bacterium]|nr:MAG: ABC transporter permease subunit [Ignavibacteriales bacterium]